MVSSKLSDYPESVTLVEVGPRDGLQNESRILPTADKVKLIELLTACGLKKIEIGSFVRADRIPPLADTDKVATLLPPNAMVYSALIPNARGLERAQEVGLSEVAIFMSVTESHNRSNINRSTGDALAGYQVLVKQALAEGLRVRAYLSTVFGCPYEGAVSPEQVRPLVSALLETGVYQVSLGDTIGIAHPLLIAEILEALLPEAPIEALALHLHDTRGTALANALMGLQMGIRVFDTAVGGLGGCPYAPGASGNLATEDLAYMLNAMGIETGIDLNKLVQASHFLEKSLGKKLSSKYSQTIPPQE
ncbi:MAG: hydroxymethylglutaryl-CoA lyase [Candidatus Sericytochromatia bacterium]|nr:hydroxymethylglutaryl-CoA lyase [Candidatus Sericytochromatia bacterium]